MPQVLVVEDDPKVRAALLRALTDRGYAVCTTATGMAGLNETLRSPPDVVLLDLGLPDVDGTAVLDMLRAVSTVPIIVVTARDEEPDMVAALNRGADDYLVKPFGPNQLDARIRAVLRRTGPGTRPTLITVGGLTIDPAARTARLDGVVLELAPKEFDLLRYLAERPDQVITKRELQSEIWRQPYGGADKTVDVHISWLRRKLGETATAPHYLHTIRNVGIRLTTPL